METKRLTIPAAEELLGLYFPVLDHGYVALVDYMGSDESIDQAARTSYGAGTRKVNERRGLLRTLRRNRHTSPIEQVELKFHMAMPIFVARQLVRHRTASLNEYSARYSVVPMLFYVPEQSVVGVQSVNNKQGRGTALTQEQFTEYLDSVHAANEVAVREYEKQIRMGVARETARGVLPLSVYTQWYWKMDLHNLFHLLGLRSDPHAQLECREYSDVLAGMTKRLAPESFEAWVDYEFCGARLSRMEIKALRSLLQFVGNADGSPAEIRTQPAEPGFQMGITAGALEENFGLSKREVVEFMQKLTPRPVPSFDLDLGTAKSPEFFAAKWADAVPKVDRVS